MTASYQPYLQSLIVDLARHRDRIVDQATDRLRPLYLNVSHYEEIEQAGSGMAREAMTSSDGGTISTTHSPPSRDLGAELRAVRLSPLQDVRLAHLCAVAYEQ